MPHICDIIYLISFPKMTDLARPCCHEQRGQLEKDHSSKPVRWKIWKTGAAVSASHPPMQQAATVWLTNWLLERPVPILLRVYWRWFWSPLCGHSSSYAICHLDCMAVSLGGVLWLLIVYRLHCFLFHKDHMHRARWWVYTVIMSLYLCAGRSGTIRPPSGSPLLSAAMLFLPKYSLLQLSASCMRHW